MLELERKHGRSARADALHDTWLKWREGEQLGEVRREGYVTVAVTRQARSNHRRQARLVLHDEIDVPVVHPIETMIEASLFWQRARPHLAMRNERYARAVELLAAGLDAKEIAVELNVTHHCVRKWFSHNIPQVLEECLGLRPRFTTV